MSGQGPERGQRGAGELAGNVLRSRIVAPPAGVGAPTGVRRVLERGLAVEPRTRWPTMDDLLAALGRDPQRARRRWLAAATLVTAIAGRRGPDLRPGDGGRGRVAARRRQGRRTHGQAQ